MQIKLKEGRNFSEEFGSDSVAIILNENSSSPTGIEENRILVKNFSWDDESGSAHLVRLIGIVEDFHFSSLRDRDKTIWTLPSRLATGAHSFLKFSHKISMRQFLP